MRASCNMSPWKLIIQMIKLGVGKRNHDISVYLHIACMKGKTLQVGSSTAKSVSFVTKQMSRVMRKPTFWFPTWSDTNQAV